MRVYHFLSAEHALSDIAFRRIRVSRYEDLNDPFELLAAKLSTKESRQVIRTWRKRFNKEMGLLCFTRAWENPTLWSHYSAKHRGICLGFDLIDEKANSINYSDNRIPVTFRDDDYRKGLSREFKEKLLYTKSSHWKYEEEIRVQIYFKNTIEEDGQYYFPLGKQLALREVILGPLCQLPVDNVRVLVNSAYKSVKVRKARLAFKWFKVVPDKRFEL